MSDDFLFDPWGDGERAEETLAPAEPRPRAGATKDTTGREPSAVEGTPEPEGAPEPVASSPAKATNPPPSGGSRWRARAVLGPLPSERSAPRRQPRGESKPALVERVDPARVATEAARNAPSGAPALPRPIDSAADRLRTIALPHLEAVAARLHIARHHALLDDRLDNRPATLRFRLVPRQAPFDGPVAVPGAVLELTATRSSVGARLWLDPVAEEPAEELEIPVAQFTEGWLDSVVVDFVAQTLRRG